MVFDGCVFDPTVFDASVCAGPATTTGRLVGRPVRRIRRGTTPIDPDIIDEEELFEMGVL